MSDDFQLRKDIDKIDRFISQLDTSISDKGYDGLEELLEEYGESIEYLDTLFSDMNTLSTDLQDLQTSLIDFNDALINFSDDNTNFANNLSKLKENLNKVLTEINTLKEGSSEFSDALAEFDIDITTFVETLMSLDVDLSILSECLDAFMDDLDGFEDALEEAEIDVSGINEDYAKLVWAVGNVRNRTSTAEGQIDELLDDIGDDTGFDPEHDTPSGIKQWISWLQYTIGSDESGHETGLIASILELSNQIGTENDTASDNTIFGNIAKALGNITTIQNKIYGVGGSENDLKSDGVMYKINNIVNNDIPAAQQDISNYKTAMFGSSTGSINSYTADSIYGRMYAILHKDSNNNEVGRLPDLEASATSAKNRLDALLDTSVTPNTGRIPSLESRTGSAEGRLDALDSNNGRIAQLETRTTNAETRLTNLDGSNGRIKQLEDRTDGAEGRLSTLDGNNGRIAQLETRTTTAEGAISDIEDEIGSDGSGNTAKSGLYLLLDNISSALNNISNNIIGSDTAQTPSGSLWDMIRNIRDTKIGNDGSNGSAKTGIYALIDGLQTSISSAQSIMGTNESTTGTNTVWGKIRKLLDDIGDAEKEVRGTLSNQAINSTHTLNRLLNVVVGDYTPVFVYDGGDDNLSDMDDLLDEFMDYILNSGSFYYVLKDGNDATFKEWVTDTNVTTSIGTTVGIVYKLDSTNVVKGNSTYYKNEPYDLIYEFLTNRFYTVQNNTWTVTNNLSDYFKYTRLGTVVSEWVENPNLTGVYHLFTNEALRECILYIDGVSSVSASSSNTVDVKTFSATEIPNPPPYNVYANTSVYSHNVRLTTDRELQVMKGDSNTTISVATQFKWHY